MMNKVRILGGMLLLAVAALSLVGQVPEGRKPVFIVPIHDEIDSGLAYFVRRSVEMARQNHAALVVFHIDTPGGRVDFTRQICEDIQSLEDDDIPTAAFVDGWAWSAGSLVSLSCDKIFMTDSSSIGSAEPINPSQEGPDPHEEKILSALRAEMRAIAQKKGYPENLAQAMVDKHLEVILVEVDGVLRYLTPEEVQEEEDAGRNVVRKRTVNAAGKLLNLTASEAVEVGLAVAAPRDLAGVYEHFGLTKVHEVRLDPTWSESMVRFLTNPFVAGILVMAGLLCLWMELKAPGFGVPGVGGLICFGLVFFGHHLAGLAEYGEIMLFGVGLVLLAAELFVIPGFGVVGVAGLLCIFASLLLSLQSFTWPSGVDAPWQTDLLVANFATLLGSFGGAVIGFLLILRFLPSSPYFHRLILQSELSVEDGFVSAPMQEKVLLGLRGAAITPLRPSGKAEIHGDPWDVVAEGDFLETGQPVEVIAVDGNRIVVRKVERSV